MTLCKHRVGWGGGESSQGSTTFLIYASSLLFKAMSSTKRLLVYTVPVTMISFALNIPKFFEVKLNEYNGTEVVNEEESRREPTFVFWYPQNFKSVF